MRALRTDEERQAYLDGYREIRRQLGFEDLAEAAEAAPVISEPIETDGGSAQGFSEIYADARRIANLIAELLGHDSGEAR